MDCTDAASIIRQLNAQELPLQRRIALGHRLQVGLALSPTNGKTSFSPTIAQDGAVAELNAIPPRVRGHYLKMLLDWTVSTLLKSAFLLTSRTQGASTEDGVAEANSGSAAAEDPTHVAARLWALLAALLRMRELGGGTGLNPALISAAAQACRAAADRLGAGHVSADLAAALLDALRLLAARDRLHISPSLEHSVAFAEAAVSTVAATESAGSGAASEGQQDWMEVGTLSLTMLRAVALRHPNQRKVYQSIVERLLVPVLCCSAPPGAPGASQRQRLVTAGRQLLDAAIFHAAHVEGLAAVGSACSSSKKRPEIQEQDRKEEEPAKGAEGGAKGHAQAPTYLCLTFQVLSRAVGEADLQKLAVLLSGLPWLLVRFKAAMKRHATAVVAGMREGLELRKGRSRDGGQSGGVPAAADFDFFALLLEPVLTGLESAAKQREGEDVGPASFEAPKKSRAPLPQEGKRLAKKRKLAEGVPATNKTRSDEDVWPTMAEGAALLLGALKTAGIYRATEDVTGSQRELLGRLGTAVLLPLQGTRQVGGSGDSEYASASNTARRAAAATAVLGAIMDVEHRALQAKLETLWEVLWASASYTSSRGADEGDRSAAEVAGRLVRAYGELRQVELLLRSLAAALASPGCPPTAARAVDDPAFAAALRQTIHEAPPGQKPKIVAFVAAAVPQLLSARVAIAPAFSALLCGCLEGLRIDLTTSAAVASALELLISQSLAPPLRDKLWRVTNGSSQGDGLPQLAVMLQLYALATRAHAACAALQPQVAPLPGQATVLTGQGRQGLGHFDALDAALGCGMSDDQPPLPTLSSLADAVSPGSRDGPMQQAVTTCMLQRMEVLHERLLHLRFSCSIPQEPASSPAGAPATSDSGSSDAFADTSEVEAETAAELRALADRLIAIAGIDGERKAEPRGGGGSEVLQHLLSHAGLLLQHASSPQRALLLCVLLSLAATAQPSRAKLQQPAELDASVGSDNDVGLAPVKLLRSAAVLEVAELGEEWTQATASIVHKCLSAACTPVLESSGSLPQPEAAAAAPSKPKKKKSKGQRAALSQETAQSGQGSQAAAAVRTLLTGISQMALQTPSQLDSSDGGSEGVLNCTELLSTIEACGLHCITGGAPAFAGDMKLGSGHLADLQLLAQLFAELASVPLKYFAARGAIAAQLVRLVLHTESALTVLLSTSSHSGRGHTSDAAMAAPAVDLLRRGCLEVLPAVHSFLAALAGTGSAAVLSMLSQMCQERLDWPFVIAMLASEVAGEAAASAKQPIWGDSAMQSIMQSSAAIMGSVIRQALGNRGRQSAKASGAGDVTADEETGAIISSVGQLLDVLAAQIDIDGDSRVVGPVIALQIKTIAAAVAASMGAANAESKRRATSSIFAGPAAHSRGSANAAEVSRLMDALEVLCIRGLSAASKRIAAGEQGLENLLFCAQQQPHTGAVRDWQRTCIARAVASLLGAAAVLLDVRTRATAFSRSAGIEVKPGEGGGDGEQHAPAIVRHAAEHLHLASRFLLAPWQLQIQAGGPAVPTAAPSLLLQAALDVVAYLRAAARALHAGQAALPKNSVSHMLALQIHLLRHLMPLPLVLGPKRRLNMSLLMSIPTLADDSISSSSGSGTSSPSQAHSILREALLLSVREVVQVSTLADQERLYRSLPGLFLEETRQPAAVLPALEVLLVAMESLHSAAALRVLSQNAEELASDLVSCMQTTIAAPDETAAVVCTGLRCLESLLARDSTIELPAHAVAQALQLPALLFSPSSPAQAKAHRSAAHDAGVFAGCCQMLGATVRHRTTETRRCMALVAASARALLTAMLSRRMHCSADLARQCAEELALLYEAIADHKDTLGMYCHHLLADYVTLAAAPAAPQGSAQGDWVGDRPSSGLWPAAAAALRTGACALYGACSASQVQHVYAVLQRTAGGTRRTAMTELRQEYDRNFKFSGKV